MDTSLHIQPKPQGGAFIKDATTESFERDVLLKSVTTPVVVDFWAPWCGPCRAMMPMLEKAVANANGAVHMVKVDIDKNPELAQIFRVQSVPMVYAFFGGQPVDGFMGARPESDLKAFIEKLAALSGAEKPQAGADAPSGDPEAAKKLMAEGDALLRDEKYNEAMEKYALAAEADPASAAALGAIGWCLLSQGEMEAVREMASQFDDAQKQDARVKGLLFILDAAATSPEKPGGLADLYNLALKKIAAADLAGAIDALIDLTKKDREWQEQKARGLLLSLFEAMGPMHPLTAQGRRKLSAILFS